MQKRPISVGGNAELPLARHEFDCQLPATTIKDEYPDIRFGAEILAPRPEADRKSVV